MQIEKISENQLEVTLNLEDLKKNNISFHSFMCNSIKTQKIFFDILHIANEEIGFSLKNYEVVIEAFSIPAQNSFILLITRIPMETYLHISNTKYNKYNYSNSLWLRFDSFEDFCEFCSSMQNNINIKSSLYLSNNCYFLHIKINKIKDFFKILLISRKFTNCIHSNNYFLNENADIIIKNSAIQTCKKYFV